MIWYVIGAGLIVVGVLMGQRRKKPDQALPPPPASLTDQQQAHIDATRQAIAEATRMGIAGQVTDDPAKPGQTRIGGPILWPVGDTPPKDPNGNPMAMLAHINLADLPDTTELPRNGVLQAFVMTDVSWGLFTASANGQAYCVHWHPEGTEFASHAQPSGSDVYLPFSTTEFDKTGRQIEWTMAPFPPSVFDYRMPRINGRLDDGTPIMAETMGTLWEDTEAARPDCDVYLLGNPDFTQDDPRHDPNWDGLINLIGFSSLRGKAFMWGDMGEACFLIPPADLPAFDLKNIRYYWDCC